MNKEKLIKAIEQAEKEQEGLFVKRVLELYQMSNTKDNNPSKIKEGKSSALNDFLNNLKKEGERNPYRFTEEEIEERKKNPNIRTLEEQKEIREKLLLSKSLHGILKDNIKEELCFITKGHSNEESRILYEAGIKNLELTKFESLGIKWDIFSQNDVTSFIVDDRMLVTRVDSAPHYITKTRSNVKLSKSLFRTNNGVEGLLEIEEGLNLILINGVVLKRVEEDNTIYGFDKRNYDYQVGF